MSAADDAIDKFASSMDQQYGSVENFAHQGGLDHFLQAGRDMLQQANPAAAQAVDNLFGAAKIALDKDGNGQIQFGELADLAKDVKNLNPNLAGMDPAKQLQLQLLETMMRTQLQIMAAPWMGFGNNQNSQANPFLLPLQMGVLRTLSKFM